MVLTWRRGIFHRTLKAEQLIVSSWMSNGGLRRSVSCKKKREREDRQTQAVSLVAFGNIFPSSDTRPNFSQECWFYSRWKSDNLCLPESWEVFAHTDESRGTALRLDRAWNYTSSLQAAMLFISDGGGGKMRWTDENVFWLCRYGDGIFSRGLSDTSGDCVWASSDLRARENPPAGYIQVLDWDHQHPWWCPMSSISRTLRPDAPQCGSESLSQKEN